MESDGTQEEQENINTIPIQNPPKNQKHDDLSHYLNQMREYTQELRNIGEPSLLSFSILTESSIDSLNHAHFQ